MKTFTEKLLLGLGVLWAMPLTLLLFVFYIVPCWALGWYEYIGWFEVGWAWAHKKGKVPAWLLKQWTGWGGHAFGNITVVRDRPEVSDSAKRLLIHELEHCRQSMYLGVFHIFFYAFFYLAIRYLIPRVHGYYDNPFEIAARRAAGQHVDIWGAILKIKAAQQTSDKH